MQKLVRATNKYLLLMSKVERKIKIKMFDDFVDKIADMSLMNETVEDLKKDQIKEIENFFNFKTKFQSIANKIKDKELEEEVDK